MMPSIASARNITLKNTFACSGVVCVGLKTSGNRNTIMKNKAANNSSLNSSELPFPLIFFFDQNENATNKIP